MRVEYTPEIYHGYHKYPHLKGATFSKPSFWVSMLVFGGVTQFQAIFCAWTLLCISGTLKCIKGPNYRGRFTLASQHLYSRHEYHTAPWIVTLALKSKWAQDIKSVMSRIMPPCHANIHANEAPTVKTPKDGKMVPDSGDPVQSNGFRKNQRQTPKKHHDDHHISPLSKKAPKKVHSLIIGSEDTTEFCCLVFL